LITIILFFYFFIFFFHDPAPPEIYTLSLHDALPISAPAATRYRLARTCDPRGRIFRQLSSARSSVHSGRKGNLVNETSSGWHVRGRDEDCRRGRQSFRLLIRDEKTTRTSLGIAVLCSGPELR